MQVGARRILPSPADAAPDAAGDRPPQPKSGEARNEHEDAHPADDLAADAGHHQAAVKDVEDANRAFVAGGAVQQASLGRIEPDIRPNGARCPRFRRPRRADKHRSRSEEPTSELQSLMPISYAVF